MNKDKEFEDESKSSIRIVDRRRFDSDGEEKSDSSSAAEIKKSTPAPVVTKDPQPAVAPITQAVTNTGFTMQEPVATKEAGSDSVGSDSVGSDSVGSDSAEFSDESDISFGSFVLSLATQALMQLGQLKAPDGMSIQVDPAAAHQTIDILAMLQNKTKGNLDVKEEGLLHDALHSLRLAFLRFK